MGVSGVILDTRFLKPAEIYERMLLVYISLYTEILLSNWNCCNWIFLGSRILGNFSLTSTVMDTGDTGKAFSLPYITISSSELTYEVQLDETFSSK